jgi:HAD superfamily hydrolase (TIGR01549 family)
MSIFTILAPISLYSTRFGIVIVALFRMGFSQNILRPDTKVVVFDLDGTLYYKSGMVRRMMFHAPLEWRMMWVERTTRKHLRGDWYGDKDTFYKMYFQHMANGRLFSSNYARWWYNTRYMPLMVKLIGKYQPLGEWVLPFVQDCQQKGIKMVVLSDYGFAKEKLQALGLEPSLFDWVVSAPELGGLKPAAELMHHVAERMGVAVEDCLVIGDREDTDGEMARCSGAQFRKVKY